MGKADALRRRALAKDQDGQAEGEVLTEEEQEEKEEKELEDACEKWCGRGISLCVAVPMFFNFITALWELVTRPAMHVQIVDLAGQSAVISGGCGDMGMELGLMLLEAGASVLLGCKNESVGQATVSKLLDRLPVDLQDSATLEAWALPLDSFDSVHAFAERYQAKDPATGRSRELHMLVHAAGTTKACSKTSDELEWALQVNYLAPFLLTELLLPALRHSSPSRNVFVTSPEIETAAVDVADLQGKKNGCDPVKQYANAKQMLVMTSSQLQDNLQSSPGSQGVTSNAVNPGTVDSSFHSKDVPTARRSMAIGPMKIFAWLFSGVRTWVTAATRRSISHGAKAIYHVTTSPALDGVGGQVYSDTAGAFMDCGRASPADCGRVVTIQPFEQELQKKLFTKSKKLVGI